jgi:colicin import membrane protein
MSAALAGPFLEWRREDDLGPAVLLAVVVHLVLAAALVLGVRWQSRTPEVVTVELWQPPVPPPPVVAPEPPKPVPVPAAKAEPRLEKPDIAIKEPPKPKPKPEAKPKPKPKPVAKPAPDEAQAKRLFADALQREQQQLAAEHERQAIKSQLARDAAIARNRAIDTYVSKIHDKVKGNFNVSPNVRGNPEATFLVTQLPTGEILDAKLVISSGNNTYDEDVLRAILKSSPLPKPDNPDLFRRVLNLTFRPVD